MKAGIAFLGRFWQPRKCSRIDFLRMKNCKTLKIVFESVFNQPTQKYFLLLCLFRVALVRLTDMKVPLADMPTGSSSLNMLSVSTMVLVVMLFSGPIAEAIQVLWIKKLLTRGTFVWSNYDNSTIIIWSSWSGDLVNGNRVDDEVWRNLSAFLFVKPTLVSLHLGRCHHHCEYNLWQKIQYHPDGKSARLIKMVEGPGGLACQCQTEEGGVGSVCGQVDFLSYHQKWRLEILK